MTAWSSPGCLRAASCAEQPLTPYEDVAYEKVSGVSDEAVLSHLPFAGCLQLGSAGMAANVAGPSPTTFSWDLLFCDHLNALDGGDGSFRFLLSCSFHCTLLDIQGPLSTCPVIRSNLLPCLRGLCEFQGCKPWSAAEELSGSSFVRKKAPKIPLPPPTLSSCQPWIPDLFQGLFFWARVGVERVFFAM